MECFVDRSNLSSSRDALRAMKPRLATTTGLSHVQLTCDTDRHVTKKV